MNSPPGTDGEAVGHDDPYRAFSSERYTPWRRGVQGLSMLLLIAAPFLDIFRVDVTAGELILLDHAFTSDDLHLLLLLSMLAMFVFGGLSLFVGRAFCGWLCPKMVVNELADRIEKLVAGGEMLRRLDQPALAQRAASGVFLVGVGLLLGAGIGYVVASYIYPYPLVNEHLFGLQLSGPTGILLFFAGLTGLDMALIRHRFCKSACLYGLMQGLVADKNSLLVKFRNREQTGCIDCGACQDICPEDLDIRKSPHQMPCISCGLCIDACADVMDETYEEEVPSLIHFIRGGRWGYEMAEEPWYMKLGLTDWKRYAVLGSVLLLAAAASWQMVRADPVQLQVSATNSSLTVKTECNVGECGQYQLETFWLAEGAGNPVEVDDRMVRPAPEGADSTKIELPGGGGILRVELTSAADTRDRKEFYYRLAPGETGTELRAVNPDEITWPKQPNN